MYMLMISCVQIRMCMKYITLGISIKYITYIKHYL